jgi:hypothetical protein
MQTIMDDFFSAKVVRSTQDGMWLLILHGYKENTVAIECSEAALENIWQATGAELDRVWKAEEAATQREDALAAWIERHSS